MKIAVFDNLPEGGAKRVVYEQVKYLSTKHDVWYFSSYEKTQFDFSAYAKEVRRFELSLPNHSGFWRPLRETQIFTGLLPSYKKVSEAIRETGVDVVLVHHDKELQSPPLLWQLSLPAVYYMEEWPRVVYEPELHPLPTGKGWTRKYEQSRRQIVKSLDRQAVKKADYLIANSSFTKENIKEAYEREAEVVHPGVELKLFRPAEAAEKKHFLFLGSKSEIDGYDLLEAALEATELPIKVKYVLFEGEFRYTDEELVKLYQRSVATLCLSRQEPFGLAAVESMACGVPVIAVNEGGYKDTVVPGETGFLIERHVQSLLTAMKRISVEKENYKTMSLNARKRVEEHFSWEVHGGKIEQVLERAKSEN